MSDDVNKYSGKALHAGPGSNSPYPVSRLSPEIQLVDIAREIETADRFINSRVSAQLKIISEQIRNLQEEARTVLEAARRDQKLHHADCRFKRIPGKVYLLYQKPDQGCYFSMLAPDDWLNGPPHFYQGAYRLENDMSWTAMEEP